VATRKLKKFMAHATFLLGNNLSKSLPSKLHQGSRRLLHLKLQNYHMSWKEIKEDTNKWKDISSSWIGRLNIIKMLKPVKVIYIFIVISIKTLTSGLGMWLK
jgi:hypothetical protein